MSHDSGLSGTFIVLTHGDIGHSFYYEDGSQENFMTILMESITTQGVKQFVGRSSINGCIYVLDINRMPEHFDRDLRYKLKR